MNFMVVDEWIERCGFVESGLVDSLRVDWTAAMVLSGLPFVSLFIRRAAIFLSTYDPYSVVRLQGS